MNVSSKVVIAFLICAVAAICVSCMAETPSETEQRRRAAEACSANPACVEARAKVAASADERTTSAAQKAAEATKQRERDRVVAEQQRADTIAVQDKALKQMSALGLVTRLDGGARSIPGSRRIYIDGPLWAAFKVDEKEDIIKFLSAYRLSREGAPQVELYDDRSGRELASYGPFAGVSLNP